jgi:predicted GNAT superfamily acetyltransferase
MKLKLATGDARMKIVPISNPRDLKAAVEVQVSAWGSSCHDITPAHVLKAVAENGGLVLGAFDGDRLVGFSWGFPVYGDSKPYFYSHQTGVIEERKYGGVGFMLKKAQREYVLRMGFDLIKWTFDPMQSLNANFNVNKLGVIVRVFKENYYGELEDNINRGMPTDRFVAEWWIRSPRVVERVEKLGRPSLEELSRVVRIDYVVDYSGDLPRYRGLRRSSSRVVGIYIPKNISRLRDLSREDALGWRLGIREALDYYINREGYTVAEYFNLDEKIGVYILARIDPEEILSKPSWWISTI